VAEKPDKDWRAIDMGVRKGNSGLPGGVSVARSLPDKSAGKTGLLRGSKTNPEWARFL